MLKPLLVTFKDVGIFFKYVFSVFCRYIHFFKQMAAILYLFYSRYNIRFLLNIALILLDVHYFEAESSEKNQLLQAKCTKLLIFLENRWRPFCILSFFI